MEGLIQAGHILQCSKMYVHRGCMHIGTDCEKTCGRSAIVCAVYWASTMSIMSWWFSDFSPTVTPLWKKKWLTWEWYETAEPSFHICVVWTRHVSTHLWVWSVGVGWSPENAQALPTELGPHVNSIAMLPDGAYLLVLMRHHVIIGPDLMPTPHRLECLVL